MNVWSCDLSPIFEHRTHNLAMVHLLMLAIVGHLVILNVDEKTPKII